MRYAKDIQSYCIRRGFNAESSEDILQLGSDPLDTINTPATGDVTEDGNVNAGDLVLCTQFALDIIQPTSLQKTRCDMYIDGAINSSDLLILQKNILGQ